MRPKPKPKRLALLLPLLLVLAVLTVVGGGVGMAEEPTLTGEDVVRYPHNEGELKDAVRSVVQGTPVEDGCRFEFELTAPVGTNAVAATEIAYDPTTCRSLIETGTPANTDAGEGEPHEPGEGDDTGGNVGAQYVGMTSPTRSKGYVHTWAEDPFNIDVNRVKSYMDWHWDGSCVTQANLGVPYFWWLKTTQWKKTSSSWGAHGASCSKAYNNAEAHYKNSRFCYIVSGGLEDEPTYVDHEKVYVKGEANGDLRGSIHVTKSGGCQKFLSLQREIIRTMN